MFDSFRAVNEWASMSMYWSVSHLFGLFDRYGDGMVVYGCMVTGVCAVGGDTLVLTGSNFGSSGTVQIGGKTCVIGTSSTAWKDDSITVNMKTHSTTHDDERYR